MALWLSGHQASIVACIFDKSTLQQNTQRIMVLEGEINNFAEVMNTCWQQSSVNGIGVLIFTPTGMILSCLSFIPFVYIICHTLMNYRMNIITTHGNGIDNDYWRPGTVDRRPHPRFFNISHGLI